MCYFNACSMCDFNKVRESFVLLFSLCAPASVCMHSCSMQNKYREEAISMLGKVFGTPETSRRVRAPKDVSDSITSGDSATSFSTADEDSAVDGKQVPHPRSATVSSNLQRSTKSDTNLKTSQRSKTVIKKGVKAEPARPAFRSRAKSFDGGSSKPEEQVSGDDATVTSQSSQRESSPTSLDLETKSALSGKRPLERILSDSQLLEVGKEKKSQDTPTGLQEGQHTIHEDKLTTSESSKRDGRTSRTPANRETSQTKTVGGSSKQKKRPAKTLPTPRPVSAKPSAFLKRLAEQKKEEADLEAAAETVDAETSSTDMVTKENAVETSHSQNSHQNLPNVEESPSKKKTLPVC